VHVPFCKTKCAYCDFYSIADASAHRAFVKAVSAEALSYREMFGRFDSLYFGGGTPSVMTEKDFTDLVNDIRSTFNFAPDTECTVEMNPDDVTKKKLKLYKDLGINRVSLGLQSLNDRELVFLKRRHTAEGARRAIDLVHGAGFVNWSIDLIYGLPGQTESDWMATLNEAASRGPAHISCYELTLHHETPLGRLAAKGGLNLPSAKKQERLFLATSQFLRDKGFDHYEVSNFARGKAYRSRHNLKYWRHAFYLGLGPAAHSFSNGTRWWNCASVNEYCTALSERRRPVEGSETLSSEQLELERLFLGFRNLEGVEIRGALDNHQSSRVIEDLIARNLVTRDADRIVPTVKGYLLADRLPLLIPA